MTALTRAQVRELDRRAIEEYGVPGVVLMENAGRGAAELLIRLNPERGPVVVYCGKGNNGGDGLVIARHLDINGLPVAVALFADPETLTGDAAINYGIVSKGRVPIRLPLHGQAPLEPHVIPSLPKQPAWIVDALFGTGLSGPIREPFDWVIATMHGARDQGVNIFAVDIPSGLDCDTGQPLGATVPAHHTATFVAPKAGFAAPEAREWLGEVHVLHIGAPRALLEQYGISPT
jgi:NAD(P)H-hydrate epimerase